MNSFFENSANQFADRLGAGIGIAIAVILLIFGAIITVVVLYYGTLQKALKSISDENRQMPPGQVWLLLIPVFGDLWSFIVVDKIALSFEAEFRKRQSNSSPKPTYTLGLAKSIMGAITLIFSLFVTINSTMLFYTGYIVVIVFMHFGVWIAYWVNVASTTEKLNSLKTKNGESDYTFQVQSGVNLQQANLQYLNENANDLILKDATNYFKNGNYEKAIQLLEKGLEILPGNAAYSQLLTRITVEVENDRNLEQQYFKAKKLYENNEFEEALVIANLLVSRSKLKKYEELRFEIDKRYNGVNEAKRNYESGIKFLIAGNYFDAVEKLRKANELESKSVYKDELKKCITLLVEEKYLSAKNNFKSENYESALNDLQFLSRYENNYKDTRDIEDEIRAKLDELDALAKQKTNKKIVIVSTCVVALIILLIVYKNHHDNYNSEKAEWNLANADSSTVELKKYLEKHPEGYFKNEALKELSLRNESDSLSWRNCLADRNIKSVKDYLRNHPKGNYSKDANDILDSIYYSVCLEQKSQESFQEYLNNVINGKHKSEIESKLNSVLKTIVSGDVMNELKGVINSYYSELYSQNYDALSMFFPPVLNSYYGRRNFTKGDVIQSIRKYLESNNISSERNNIDWTTFEAKNMSDEMVYVKFNMDYYAKINYPPAENYYNVNVNITLNKDRKICSYNQTVISKNAHSVN
jgi:tetratricopeptide (TPR) repeat protein